MSVLAQAEALLGKKVRVVLSYDPPAHVAGVLLHFSDHGAVTVRDDETFETHYCWPMLEVTEVPA